MQSGSHVLIPAPGETFVGEDGTVSVVLADSVDSNYEPAQEEVEEFAEWMGMKLPDDNEFLHIAREGLKAPLPSDWRPCRANEDEIYYFNFRTGESTWNHPMDDFFRQMFLDEREKKRKKASETTSEHQSGTVETTGAAAAAHYLSTSPPALLPASQFSTGYTQVNVLKNMPAGVVGSTAGVFSPILGAAKGMVGAPVAEDVFAHKSTILHSPPTASSLFSPVRQGSVTGGSGQVPLQSTTSSSSGGAERRIMSEAEKTLEEKIRQECEASFKLEEEKAEHMMNERLKNLRNSHEAELKKLQEDFQGKREVVRSRVRAEKEESLKRQRQDLEEKWRTSLEQVLREEADIQTRLSQLRDEHERQVTDEVAKAERIEKEQFERQVKQMKAEAALSVERLRAEARAEFMKKKDALHQKAQETLLELRNEIEKQHKAELFELRQKYEEDVRLGKGAGAATVDERSDNDEDAQIAAIKTRQREELAVILRQSREDQAAFHASMRKTLSQLQGELLEIEGPAVVSHREVSNSSMPADDELDEVRRRWWEEKEAEGLKVLEEERRKRLAEVELLQKTPFISSPLNKISTVSASSTTSASMKTVTSALEGEGKTIMTLREENDAALAVKRKTFQEIETFLRTTLEEELTRADAPEMLQIEVALEGAFNVFVRSTEAWRRFEEEDFNRRRDRVLAEHASAKAVYDQKVAIRKAELESEALEEIQEMLSKTVQDAVDAALRAVAAEHEVSLRQMSRRYEDERRTLFAEVEKEMLAYEQTERRGIDEQGVKEAECQEAKLCLAAKRTMEQGRSRAATVVAKQEERQPSGVVGVSAEVLQRRLRSIERSYAEREQRLEAELEAVREEVKKLGDALALQEHKLPLPSSTASGAREGTSKQQQGQGHQLQQLGTYSLPHAGAAIMHKLTNEGNKTLSPSVSSEALCFLNEQQCALNTRRDALRAARDEWQSDVRNATCGSLYTVHGEDRCDIVGAEGNAVSPHLLTLVGTLGDRLEHLTRHVTVQRTTRDRDVSLDGRQRSQEMQQELQNHLGHHHRSHSGRHNVRENSASGGGKKALHGKHSRKSPTRVRSPIRLVQKWSHVLLEFAEHSTHLNDFSASLRRYMTDQ